MIIPAAGKKSSGNAGGFQTTFHLSRHLLADQLEHSLDVNQNVYTQSAVSKRQIAVNRLENSLIDVQMEFTVTWTL